MFDVVLVLLALVLLVLVARSVWRRSKALTRELGRAVELVAGTSAALSAPAAPVPTPGAPHRDVQPTHT